MVVKGNSISFKWNKNKYIKTTKKKIFLAFYKGTVKAPPGVHAENNIVMSERSEFDLI